MEIDEINREIEAIKGKIANLDYQQEDYRKQKKSRFWKICGFGFFIMIVAFIVVGFYSNSDFGSSIRKLAGENVFGIAMAQGYQTGYVDPNGDLTPLEWYSTGASHYTEIDEIDGDQENLDTGDYISVDYEAEDVSDVFDMETIAGNNAVTNVKIWAYGMAYESFGTGYARVYADIYMNSAWVGQQILMQDTSDYPEWFSTTFNGTWNQTDLDNMRVKLRFVGYWPVGYVVSEIYAMYGEVNYTEEVGDTTPPTITFNFKNPADITSINLFGINLTVSYNISDESGINLSTVRLYHKTNSSYLDGSIYINGTLTEGWIKDANFLNDSISFNWTYTEAHVYPGTYNFDAEDMWYEPHSIQALPKDNYFKIRFFNVSNTSSYGIFEIMINSSENKNALIYYCNSSYGSGSLNNPNCHNFYTLIPGTGFNHSHSEYSSHKVIPLAITDGGINGVRVTETSYMVIKGEAGWNVYYISNISREDTIQYSDDKAETFSNFSGTVDAHLHQYNGNAFHYFAEACDLLGNCGNSTVGKDLIVLDGLPPTSPYVYSPVNQTYYNNENININYTASISPSGYDIVSYNISMLNSDETFNLTIINNNYPDLGYIWNISSILNGSYIVKVEGCDNQTQCSFGLSEGFSVIEYTPPPPPPSVQLCNWAVWNGTGDINNLTNMGGMMCFNNSIGSFIWGRYDDSTCYKKVIATNQIINTTCPK